MYFFSGLLLVNCWNGIVFIFLGGPKEFWLKWLWNGFKNGSGIQRPGITRSNELCPKCFRWLSTFHPYNSDHPGSGLILFWLLISHNHLIHHNLCSTTFDFSMDHNHVQHFCLIVRNWKVICCEFQIAETMSSRVAESSKVLKQFNQFQSVQSVSKHFIFRNHSFLTISGSLPGCTLFYHKFLHVPYLQRDPVTSSIVHEWHTFFGTKYI